MYQSIVVGTDGSESATEAVVKAAEVARLNGARLHVVNAFEDPAGHRSQDLREHLPEESEWMASAGIAAEVILRHAVDAIAGTNVEVEQHARVGDPASCIIDIALELKADLVVVGNKGMTGLARFLLGSVPSKISHHAPCDVLIVRTV